MGEGWRDMEGYEGLYQISNLGRVKSVSRYQRDGRFREEMIMKLTIGSSGYLTVTLHDKNGEWKTFWVSRLVGLAFVPNPEGKPQVGHKDENKLNNISSNLEWVTQKENNGMPLRRERLSRANMGKRPSEETLKKLSESHKGNKQSDEAKQKIRESDRNRFKPVVCDGVIYECTSDCAKAYSKSRTLLYRYLNGKHKMPKIWQERGLKYYYGK